MVLFNKCAYVLWRPRRITNIPQHGIQIFMSAMIEHVTQGQLSQKKQNYDCLQIDNNDGRIKQKL